MCVISKVQNVTNMYGYVYRKRVGTIPRKAWWLAHAKVGVPNSIIQLIQPFHQDMQAIIQLDGNTLDLIAVENEVVVLHQCFSTYMHVSLLNTG